MNQGYNQEFKDVLRKLYPYYSESQLDEVDDTFYRHIALLVRITERLANAHDTRKSGSNQI